MQVIKARNVNDAFPQMIGLLRGCDAGPDDSRSGKVRVAHSPVTTVYQLPSQRVLFDAVRDANPFFHLIESLWMLAGRDDLATLKHYVRRFESFSDNGVTLHGAYGHRWRYNFDIDQIEHVVALLTRNPKSRRAVIQMYDPRVDAYSDESHCKDVPCNLTITPWIRKSMWGSLLDMTVFCRSNDVIWGAAGANIVHFSVLQEYLAARLGLRGPGTLYQVSNNFHAYDDVLDKQREVKELKLAVDPYTDPLSRVRTTPLVSNVQSFLEDINWFFVAHDQLLNDDAMIRIDPSSYEWGNELFPRVVIPMVNAYYVFRTMPKEEGRFAKAANMLGSKSFVMNYDWLRASYLWLERRSDNGL